MTMVGDAYAAPLVEELQRSVPTTCRRCTPSAPAERRPIRSTSAALLELLPQHHDHQRLRLVGDRQHGLRAQPARFAPRDTFDLREGGTGAVRGLQPVPAARRGPEVGWVARDGPNPAWATSTMPRPPSKTFPVVEGQRVVISGDRGVAGARRHAAAVRPGLAGGQHRRREGLRRGGRGGAARAPRGRRRAGGRPRQRAVGSGDRRAGRSCTPGATSTPRHCTPHCTAQLARFKAPKEFIFVEQVRRLGNGKADYRWAKSEAARQQRCRLP